jgi:protein-S-isoprenylcysteine O-methyltransferase Ste14
VGKTLQFRNEKAASTGPKAAITAWYLICASAAVWLTFGPAAAGGAPGDVGRRVVLIASVAVYIVRAAHTLFAFVTRRIPWWEAAWGGGIIGTVLFFFLLTGLRVPQPLGPADLAAALLYVAGSWLGTASELARHRWKARPENRGHLYTEGLFRLSRHVNYFGDLLLFAGCAILARQWWAAIVPAAMALNFVLVIIPAHDAYLAGRYGREFDDYARRTKKLIPLVY